MSEDEVITTVDAAVAEPAKKPKAKQKTKVKAKAKVKTKPAQPKGGKPARPSHDFDFVGKVESLKVTSSASGFEFGLRGRHGKRKSFRFDTADQFAMNAMAHVVLAAHAGETKVGVRTAAEVDGILIVRELESRPKLGK